MFRKDRGAGLTYRSEGRSRASSLETRFSNQPLSLCLRPRALASCKRFGTFKYGCGKLTGVMKQARHTVSCCGDPHTTEWHCSSDPEVPRGFISRLETTSRKIPLNIVGSSETTSGR